MENRSPLQIIKTGGCHTMVINSRGKVFSWGWNNNGQCGQPLYTSYRNYVFSQIGRDTKGRIPSIPVLNYLPSGKSLQIEEIGTIKSLCCGEDHTFLLDERGNAFAFGNNNKGQLGLGNVWEVEKPTLIRDLKGKVKEIHSSGDTNLAVTFDNELYVWPFENFNQNFKPIRMYMDNKIIIQTVSCGKNFAIVLSKQGILYSFGKGNKKGELGLGDYKQRLVPEPIYSLADAGEKITQISCGFKHTLAKSNNGKVFSWGNNSDGQLAVGDFISSPHPMQVNFDNLFPYRIKVIQVSAGFRSSFYMVENRQIVCAGTTGVYHQSVLPVKFDFSSRTPEIADDNSYSPIRIMNTWNKSFSIFYCTVGDIRLLSAQLKNKSKINTILNTLATKWETDSIDAPYIESIAGYFHPSFMKKKEEKKVEKNPHLSKEYLKKLI